MNFPADLKYTKDHEWIRVDGNVAYVGITDYDRCRDKNRKETVYAEMAGNDIPFLGITYNKSLIAVSYLTYIGGFH